VPFLLPHLEQESLYKIYRWDKSWKHPLNQPAVNTRLSVVRCPSAPDGPERIDKITLTDKTKGTAQPSDYAPPTSYAGGLEQLQLVKKRPKRAATMPGGRSIPVALVTDGSSNTLMVTEDAGRPMHWVANGERGPNKSNNGCGNYNVNGGRVWGAGWADTRLAIPLHGFTFDGLFCHGPCAINCTNNNEAYSFHRGGINAVFADGSVHFVAETIGIEIYASMVTRAGEEVLPADAY
jgi:prepilin-type processing-associated H-X9-DG protein